jgi:transglutaminase-like putative cysteine protease
VYRILDRMKKAVKDKTMTPLIEGIRKHQDEIRLPSMYTSDMLRDFLEMNVMDNPEFFYVSGFKYFIRGNEITVIPSYTYSLQEILRLSKQCQKIAAGLVKRANLHDLYEGVKILHDFLARNVVYEDDGKKERHNIVGSLVEKKAVCDGYSAAFKYLLDRIGVPCVIVTGTAWDQLSGADGRHAWNMVKLEDEWTHVDVTFDTTMSSFNIIRYDYFG